MTAMKEYIRIKEFSNVFQVDLSLPYRLPRILAGD